MFFLLKNDFWWKTKAIFSYTILDKIGWSRLLFYVQFHYDLIFKNAIFCEHSIDTAYTFDPNDPLEVNFIRNLYSK
jgi:hypothetical protein